MNGPITTPPGLTVRPATLDDAAAVCALLGEIDTLETGSPDTTLAEVLADLKHPEIDLAIDSWLVFEGETLIAYGLVWDKSCGERIDMDHYTLPDRTVGAMHLFELMEERAARRAAGYGADRAVIHLHLNAAPTTDLDDLRARGRRTVRRYNVLHRPLDPAADPVPAPPGSRCGRAPTRRTAAGRTPCSRRR